MYLLGYVANFYGDKNGKREKRKGEIQLEEKKKSTNIKLILFHNLGEYSGMAVVTQNTAFILLLTPVIPC